MLQKVYDWVQRFLFDPDSGMPFLSVVMLCTTIYVLYKLIRAVLSLCGFCYRHSCRPGYDLMERYGGDDSYVVVTGGSEGIGFEICLQMAKRGFNICMIARNEEKMKQRLDDIREYTRGNVKLMHVVADFSQMPTFEDYERILEPVKALDVAIVFANAGLMDQGPFTGSSAKRMEQMIHVNTFQPTFVIKVLLEKMLARQKRSALVVTSSILGTIPIAGAAVYAATKAYASSFTQALGYELGDRIDIHDWPCGEVKTRLQGDFGVTNPRAITVEEAVGPILKQIGKDRIAYGNKNHEMGTYLFNEVMSKESVNDIMFKHMSKIYDENIGKKNSQEMEAYHKQGVL